MVFSFLERKNAEDVDVEAYYCHVGHHSIINSVHTRVSCNAQITYVIDTLLYMVLEL